MKKRTLILAAMVTLCIAFTACGGKTTETSSGTETSKAETAKESKNSKKKIVPEEEIVVRVGDVEIPLASTWTELFTLAYEQGWDVDDSLYPNEAEKKFSKKGHLYTPQGEVLVSLMANEDKTEAVVEYIALSPFYMESDDADILGVKTDTSVKKIGKSFELIESDEETYFYKVDDFVTLKVKLNTDDGKNTVSAIRTKYHNREE